MQRDARAAAGESRIEVSNNAREYTSSGVRVRLVSVRTSWTHRRRSAVERSGWRCDVSGERRASSACGLVERALPFWRFVVVGLLERRRVSSSLRLTPCERRRGVASGRLVGVQLSSFHGADVLSMNGGSFYVPRCADGERYRRARTSIGPQARRLTLAC